MLPPNPGPMIVQIDGISPTRKPDEIPEEPLIPPPSDLFITESGHQIISSISNKSGNPQDKGKKIAIGSNSPTKSFRKSKG